MRRGYVDLGHSASPSPSRAAPRRPQSEPAGSPSRDRVPTMRRSVQASGNETKRRRRALSARGASAHPRRAAVPLIATDVNELTPPETVATGGWQGDTNPPGHLANRRAVLGFPKDDERPARSRRREPILDLTLAQWRRNRPTRRRPGSDPNRQSKPGGADAPDHRPGYHPSSSRSD